jgi:signal transduction histidine kinase
MATIVDLTARQQAAEHLSLTLTERDNLRRRLMQAQEQERLRLSQDLHDQTGQVVAAAMMELKGIEKLVNESGRDRIRNLRGRLEQMSKALHRIARELRPASIEEIGLSNTLTDYVAEWSAQFGIAAEFYCGHKKIDDLSDEVSTSIYRLIQEALTNISKHALGATAIGVIIDFAGSELRLTIEDNGCGFDAEAPTKSRGRGRAGGLGLDGMRERLSLIGGNIKIESSIGAGTTLFIRIPLEQERMTA